MSKVRVRVWVRMRATIRVRMRATAWVRDRVHVGVKICVKGWGDNIRVPVRVTVMVRAGNFTPNLPNINPNPNPNPNPQSSP